MAFSGKKAGVIKYDKNNNEIIIIPNKELKEKPKLQK